MDTQRNPNQEANRRENSMLYHHIVLGKSIPPIGPMGPEEVPSHKGNQSPDLIKIKFMTKGPIVLFLPTWNKGPPFRGRGRGYQNNYQERGHNTGYSEGWKQSPNGEFGQQSPYLGHLRERPEWELNVPTHNSFFPPRDKDGPEGKYLYYNFQHYQPMKGANSTPSYQPANGNPPNRGYPVPNGQGS